MNLSSELKKLGDRYARLQSSRTELQQLSGAAQRLSKQAIFSMQRGDAVRALELLGQAEGALKSGLKIVTKVVRLQNDGMWRSSLEEFTEAAFFCNAAQGKSLFPVHSITDDPDILIGGLSDTVGEFVRLAVQSATDGDAQRIDTLHTLAEQVIEFLLSIDATGQSRQKVDQARQHLRRLEDIRYDISRRT